MVGTTTRRDGRITAPEWGRRHGFSQSQIRTLVAQKDENGLPFVKDGNAWVIDPDTPPPIDNEVISCQVCGAKVKQISSVHLTMHDMTMDMYREKFPDAPLVVGSVRAKVAASKVGKRHSEETIAKISENRKGKGPATIGPHSAERREKISLAHRGKTLSEEHKNAISAGLTGRTHTEETKEKMRSADIDYAERQQKVVETNRARYGVDNVMQNKEIREQYQAKYEEKTGFKSPLENPEIRNKAYEQNIINHGVHSSKLPETKQKVKDTKIQKYGNVDGLYVARQAYRDQTGYENPFQNPDVIADIRKKLIQRYGVEYPLQSDEVLQKMMERNLQKYGYDNVGKVPEFIQKRIDTSMESYNRPNPAQSHYSDEAFSFLNNETEFREVFKTSSLREIAQKYSVSYETIRRMCDRYGIPKPKSSYEQSIGTFIEEMGFKVVYGNRKLIGFEIDILVEDTDLAIEFGGLYWHTEDKHADKSDYHLAKTIACEENGKKLLTIFEDEWVSKNEICKARIRHSLGKSVKGPSARQCTVRHISHKEAEYFLEMHHIQGAGQPASVRLGAFHNGELVAVMTFGAARYDTEENTIELLRFATDGRSMAGIASKLFSTFTSENDVKRIVSYADRRWSDGSVYPRMGFVASGASVPSYGYFKSNGELSRVHRVSMQKHKIKHLVEDGENKTEVQIANELGYKRIWDCGTLKFVWER